MSKRKIELEETSDFDLVTQLKIEQEKFSKHKSQSKYTLAKDRVNKKKPSYFERSNKGIESRMAKDETQIDPQTLNLDDKIQLSKKSLEKKAQIYELLAKKGKELVDDETDIQDKFGENILTSKFLIDFEKKGFDQHDDQESDNNHDDEYVEIEDEFGRTRKVLKSELAQKKDDYIFDDNDEPHLMSEDMRRERERQRWEEDTLREIKQGPEHYDANNEVRQLGVGFYKFSQGEERYKQMEELNKLRRETERIRKENELSNLKKQKMIEERKLKLQKMKEKKVKPNLELQQVSDLISSLMPKPPKNE